LRFDGVNPKSAKRGFQCRTSDQCAPESSNDGRVNFLPGGRKLRLNVEEEGSDNLRANLYSFAHFC
jgi:hypothetical protein